MHENFLLRKSLTFAVSLILCLPNLAWSIEAVHHEFVLNSELPRDLQPVSKFWKTGPQINLGLKFREENGLYRMDYKSFMETITRSPAARKPDADQTLEFEFQLSITSDVKAYVPCTAQISFGRDDMSDRISIFTTDSTGLPLLLDTQENVLVVKVPFDPPVNLLSGLSLKPSRKKLIVSEQKVRPLLGENDRLELAFMTTAKGNQYGNMFNYRRLLELIHEKQPHVIDFWLAWKTTVETNKKLRGEKSLLDDRNDAEIDHETPTRSETNTKQAPAPRGLLDPELRERVKAMQAQVSQRIFGQEYAVQKNYRSRQSSSGQSRRKISRLDFTDWDHRDRQDRTCERNRAGSLRQ